MLVKQLAIFVENKPGRLREITRVLAQGGVSILGFSLADTARFGILRMIVDDTARALAALEEARVKAAVTQALALRVPDCPGGLDAALAILAEAGIGVEYAYSYLSHVDGAAVVLLCLDDNAAGVALLREHGVELLTDDGMRMA